MAPARTFASTFRAPVCGAWSGRAYAGRPEADANAADVRAAAPRPLPGLLRAAGGSHKAPKADAVHGSKDDDAHSKAEQTVSPTLLDV